jgi:hypothetical protein
LVRCRKRRGGTPASARRFARTAPVWRGPWTTRLSAFRFPFRHCEQREAIQSGGKASGGKALDCFVASLLAMTNILAVFKTRGANTPREWWSLPACKRACVQKRKTSDDTITQKDAK